MYMGNTSSPAPGIPDKEQVKVELLQNTSTITKKKKKGLTLKRVDVCLKQRALKSTRV